MQYTYATSAYHEAKFLVHFHLAIRTNFERGERPVKCTLFFFLMRCIDALTVHERACTCKQTVALTHELSVCTCSSTCSFAHVCTHSLIAFIRVCTHVCLHVLVFTCRCMHNVSQDDSRYAAQVPRNTN